MNLDQIKSPKRKWRLWSTLAFLSAFPALATDMYLPSFPKVASHFDVPISTVGLTLSAFFVGTALGQLMWGPLSDRFGRKSPTFLGIVIFIAGSILCFLAPTLPVLVLARFVQAFGGSAAMVISRAITRDLFSGQQMAQTMSAVSSIFMAAPILAPSIGSLILMFANWTSIFLVLAVFGLLIGLNFLSFPETLEKRPNDSEQKINIFRSYFGILRNQEFLLSASQLVFSSFFLFTYISLIPAVAMNEFGFSTVQFGLLFGGNALALILGSQINFRLLKTRQVRQALKFFVAVQVVASILFLVSVIIFHALFISLPFLVIAIGCAPAIGGNSTTLAMEPFKEKAAQASALIGTIQSLGAASVAAVLVFIPGDAFFKMACAMTVISVISITIFSLRRNTTKSSS